MRHGDKSAAIASSPLCTTISLPIIARCNRRGQTISQPYIVALMTDLLDPSSTDTVPKSERARVTQAAVLRRLWGSLHWFEIVAALGPAPGRFSATRYRNVEVRVARLPRRLARRRPFDVHHRHQRRPRYRRPIGQLKPGDEW